MTSRPLPRVAALAAACLAATLGCAAWAGEAEIRKALAERVKGMPAIDEISKTSIPGVYEIRMGTDVIYSDENGDHIFEGRLVETRSMTDLTERRIDKLTAFDVAKLPLKDAILIKQGTGTRKLVVFSDPNCGYCKRLERDLLALKDVSIYTYLFPVLGPDSTAKSRDIWCAKDPAKVWRDWMIDGSSIPKAMGTCDTAALERNLALGQKHRVRGTPAVVFPDGSRAPGALPLQQIEARLLAASKKS